MESQNMVVEGEAYDTRRESEYCPAAVVIFGQKTEEDGDRWNGWVEKRPLRGVIDGHCLLQPLSQKQPPRPKDRRAKVLKVAASALSKVWAESALQI